MLGFRQLNFECGQQVLQHVLTQWLCQTVCNIVLRTDFPKPFWIASCKLQNLTLMCFSCPHPRRSASALAADESVSRMMCILWYSPRTSCTCFASASADTIPLYSASAELRLTLPRVRLIVDIVLLAYLSTIPVVLLLVITQSHQSLSHVAVSSLSRASVADGFELPNAHSFRHQVTHDDVCWRAHASCKLFHGLLCIWSLSCKIEKSSCHSSIESRQHCRKWLLGHQILT